MKTSAIRYSETPNSEEHYLFVLRDLLDSLQVSYTEEELVEVLPPNGNGQDLQFIDILNALARFGFQIERAELDVDEIDHRLLPCLFTDAREKNLCIIRSRQDLTALSLNLQSGIAYFFQKQDERTENRSHLEQEGSGKSWTYSVLGKFNPFLKRLFWISLFLNLTVLGLPVFLMVIYDRIVDITTPQTVYALGLGALLVLFLDWSLRRLRSHYLSWISTRISHMIGNAVLSRLAHLPSNVIESASVASQLSRIKGFEALRDFMTGPVFLTLLDFPFILIALLALGILAPQLVFVPVGVLMIYVLLTLFVKPRLSRAMASAAAAKSREQAHHIELLERLPDLRLSGMSEVWLEQFRELSGESSEKAFQSQYLSQILEIMARAIIMASGIFVLYCGVHLVWNGQISGGVLFAALLLTWRILGPLQTICGSLPRLEQLYRTLQQIDRLMEMKTERSSATGLLRLPQLRGAYRFHKVGLRYSKDADPVFAGLSFSVEPGQWLAITGGNASGKSTILKLALGLYRPQAGAIYLDDHDLRQLDPVFVRKSVSYIAQIHEFFDGTILDNMRLANPVATQGEISRAFEMADLSQDISALPDKLNTYVPQNGGALSSTFLFKLNLARAYLRDAPILMIDELPYTILNSPVGEKFIETIKSWHGKKTILMVSHRNDHIRLADQVLGLLGSGNAQVGSPEMVIKTLRDLSLQNHGMAFDKGER